MDDRRALAALEREKISKLLIKFSVPCVMGLLISAFYNIVDQIFVGNSELGYLGNAATGDPCCDPFTGCQGSSGNFRNCLNMTHFDAEFSHRTDICNAVRFCCNMKKCVVY